MLGIECEVFAIRCVEAQEGVVIEMPHRRSIVPAIAQHYLNPLVYEVESALVSHEAVAEAAVVGAQDAMTGQGIVAFVILRGGIAHASGEKLVTELRNHVAKEIGAIAKPRQILVVAELPKTRSGKIMRRLLKDVAENRQVGDATTLADPNVMKLISEGLNTSKDED